ncbi:hypothetical protein Clacol_001084 [Clathrus columnatus]|uniref:Uncharacterized protein n=1 Tax=Clathrus columnatus TaxID=1419009 RepID=A0AAV5A069_9AGAM|nr:hypothetical protein Clacol_001084 [Clathrus columnatus]
MKTVRTRVKSAFNKRGSTAKPLDDDLQQQPGRQSSTSVGPSILRPSTELLTQEPLPSLTTPFVADPATAKDNIPEFHLESDPFADLSSSTNTNNSRDKSKDTPQNRVTFLPEVPPPPSDINEQQQQQQQDPEDYMFAPSAAQDIIITDDSRRSTPKKRKKSVPRASSASFFPSPSITSRILTVLPEMTETTRQRQDELRVESPPINLNYLVDGSEKETSLLEQPQPTEAIFIQEHEATPIHESQSIPPMHELLTQFVSVVKTPSYTNSPAFSQFHRRMETPIQPDHLTPYHPHESSTVWPLPPQTFPTLGWTEHVLPSSAYYYSHAATRTVTDLDLRDNKKLNALTQYISSKRSPKLTAVDIPAVAVTDNSKGGPGHDTNTIRTLRTEPEFLAEEGIDIWIRDANAGMPNSVSSNAEWEFTPLTNWVMHATRAVAYDPPSDKDPAPEDLSDAERLSLEYKYWQYMCTHPAHVSIPQSAYDEALEVLTWCYTDSVMHASPSLPYPPPFRFNECTALLELIRNISNSTTSASSQTMRTRLIAQILLRYTEWRQKYITKSLPTVSNNGNGRRASSEVEHAAFPFKATFQGIIKSVVCLGIPYLFERTISTSNTNDDEEVQCENDRKASKVNISLDASQPIMSALLLSASATMLTFPNLNQTTRVSAMISALFAVTSMASYGISLYVGVLAYAIGGSENNTTTGFGRITGWIVLAVWIALVGILAALIASLKRGS